MEKSNLFVNDFDHGDPKVLNGGSSYSHILRTTLLNGKGVVECSGTLF